jgi:hypothetical protein
LSITQRSEDRLCHKEVGEAVEQQMIYAILREASGQYGPSNDNTSSGAIMHTQDVLTLDQISHCPG